MSLLGKAILSMLAGVGLLAAMASGGAADEKADNGLAQQLVGAWFLTVDHDKDAEVGSKAKGSVMFDGNGNFALQIVGADLPTIASNDRLQGTADENEAVVQQSLAYFGTYDVNEPSHGISLHIYYSSFANWRDTDQKWTVRLTADQMSWTRPGSVAATLVWQHAPTAGAAVPTTRGRHY